MASKLAAAEVLHRADREDRVKAALSDVAVRASFRMASPLLLGVGIAHMADFKTQTT